MDIGFAPGEILGIFKIFPHVWNQMFPTHPELALGAFIFLIIVGWIAGNIYGGRGK